MKKTITTCLLFLAISSTYTAAAASHAVASRLDSSRAERYYLSSHRIDVNKTASPGLYYELYKWMRTQTPYVDCALFANEIYTQVYKKQIDGRALNVMKFASSQEINSNASEGDLLLFKVKNGKVNQVGIYLKQGNFAHLTQEGFVIISNIHDPDWSPYIFNTVRMPESTTNND
jgi:murein DD-endopeptidase / murein LD-carboxypeptidase